MGFLPKEVAEITGLTEAECLDKLVGIARENKGYKTKRKSYDDLGLGKTYHDFTWGFITLVLGSNPQTLSAYIV